MIEIRNVEKIYSGETKVLNGITLNIQEGCIYGLVGRSGAGKSTLLRCINGLETFQSGEIIIAGRPVSTASDYEARKARREIGMVFQNFSLLERLNVYENIALPMKGWGYKKFEIEKRVKELLALVGLEDKRHAYPSQISGGQKQRVAIARALTMEPRILLCDEATSALDPKTADSILNLLKKINKETGITIVVVTHQLSVIRKICSHMAILENGCVAEAGETTRIFVENPPALRNLRGEEETDLGNKKANLYIGLEGENAGEAVFTHFVREMDTDFFVLDMQRSVIGQRLVLHYELHVPEEKKKACMDWFQKQGITCSLIGNPAEGGARNV